jgi:hypothetical protein
MTFNILSISYRSLQSVLRCPENTVKRNSRGDVLRAEVQRLLDSGVLNLAQLEALPTSAPKTVRFDWEGLATDRKHAVELLKAARALGHTTVKLNAPNVSLLAALRTVTTTPIPTTPCVVQPVVHKTPIVSKVHKAPKAQTITTPATLTVKVPTKPEPTQLEREKATVTRLLAERERLEIRLALSPDCEYTHELLEECREDLSTIPARAWV